jgi:hypothetical protein
VLNCSRTSVFVETQMRLSPNSRCAIGWPEIDGAPTVMGRITRCHVGRLDAQGEVQYYAAIRFELPAPFLRELDTRDG